MSDEINQLYASMMSTDATGDEKLWVLRYVNCIVPLSAMAQDEAPLHANAAYESWGHDPDTTPEEVAEADLAEMRS